MYRGHYTYSMPKAYASLKMPEKFPEDIECVIKGKSDSSGSIYISNIEAAQNANTLKKLGIKAILTCAKGYELKHSKAIIPDYKYISAVDHEGCQISGYFDEAADFIKDCVAKTNLLVHCIAGVSRSVSMVIAYLIRENGMTYDEAYRIIKARRRIIHPNDGFISQLKKYEQQRRTLTPSKRSTATTPKKESMPKQSETATPIKRGNYLGEDLKQFKSTQLTPQPVRSNYEQKLIERHQSTQLTPNKIKANEYTPQLAKKAGYDMYLTSSTSVYSPDKKDDKQRRAQLMRNYDIYRSPYSRPNTDDRKYKAVSEKMINYDLTPQKYDTGQNRQHKTISPKFADTFEKTVEDPQKEESSNKKGYFNDMNKELSEKIAQIRQKYDKQRQKLYSKYQTVSHKSVQKGPTPEDRLGVQRDYSVKNYGSVEPKGKDESAYQRTSLQANDASVNRNYLQGKQYLYQRRTSYEDNYRDLYTKKVDLDTTDERRDARAYQGGHDDIRRNVDLSMGNLRSPQRLGQLYNDYSSQYPYYGYRRF